MTMITPSYLGETIEYSSLHACRSTLEDPTNRVGRQIIQHDADALRLGKVNVHEFLHAGSKVVTSVLNFT